MNRENLLRLATYLETLPADYGDFDMSTFALDNEGDEISPRQVLSSCGTVACAAGHGPAAGLTPLPEDHNWSIYCKRVFGLSVMDETHREFDWCFGGAWDLVDNTHHGAAKRIRHMLDHGLPLNASKQMFGDAPYMFAPGDNA